MIVYTNSYHYWFIYILWTSLYDYRTFVLIEFSPFIDFWFPISIYSIRMKTLQIIDRQSILLTNYI